MSKPSIIIVGSNHECASVDLRERLAFNGETLTGGLRALRQHVDEALIISTCNRTELYAVAEDGEQGRERIIDFLSSYHGMPRHVLDSMSYAHTDASAVRHIFRVASGLDSIVLGEPQILAQIRDALEAARTAESAGAYLQRLATDALKVGKQARTETDIARNNLSISHAAVALAERERPDLATQRVTLLGAGKMASIAARVLAARGVAQLTIVNRSVGKAEQLAAQIGATARPTTELREAIAESDVVIAAILTEEPVIVPLMLEGRTKPLLLIDLGVPRIVDRGCGYVAQVEARDVDDLESVAHESRQRYSNEMNKVEQLVDRAIDDYLQWARSRTASDAIAALRHQSDAVRDREVERALRRLGHLSERDQNVVRAMAKALTNTLMHEPVQSLRNAGSELEIRSILAHLGVDPDEPDDR
ncbi:MAG TPA: glutamyl-tRNA reductase [Thermomicrobiales bacterium]|nr:glutamyl-tRNA reductase [Thermomicrobiales bacterium]